MLALKDQHLFKQRCYIDGRWLESASGKSIPVTNPADGSILGSTPELSYNETHVAIEAAETAWKSWRKKTAKERSALLNRWFDLIMAAQEDLATLITMEQGKALSESRAEVAYAASFIEWFAEEGKRIYGDTIPPVDSNNRIVVIKEPIGVCAAITPWNFPAAMITRKAAPALAAGCTMVLKPSELTPFTAFALAELSNRAGIPDGVFNVITGVPEEIGAKLTSDPIVRKLTFTGSTAVGRLLMKQCAGTIKKLSLELGGNAPFIVFSDADIDEAVTGAVTSKYRNSGQTCVCTNRFFVQETVYEEFAKKLVETVENLKVGNGMERDTQQGPLINRNALEKVEAHIKDAVNKGANILTGGKRHPLGGTFFEPTVIGDITGNMRIATEETFGPVAPIFKFKTEAEAIQMANSTEYGLAAYFYSRDVGRIWRVSEALEYGIIGINAGLISTEVAPFGGLKQSGIGREGSKYGIEEFLEIKYLCMGGINH
ncbi:MAG: NAD-dependent succinate-semialdehyde dehydrogenase [Desulfobacterales bacterium]|nr:NAD-dependent succinate-semialdehyde dehydrogenase [Desulfobacterales bacterium]